MKVFLRAKLKCWYWPGFRSYAILAWVLDVRQKLGYLIVYIDIFQCSRPDCCDQKKGIKRSLKSEYLTMRLFTIEFPVATRVPHY